MTHPAFFGSVRAVTLYDPLAELLGASEGGLLEYGFTDAVKLAGHSCPTVAGAYLMTLKALTALYGKDIPVRGNIRVSFRDDQSSGVTGVIANVVSQITGAAGEGGFKGLAGKYKRNGLLSFNADIGGMIRYERTDRAGAVETDFHPERVLSDRNMSALLQGLLSQTDQPGDRAAFASMWQERVRRILIDYCDDPALVTLKQR
ncbi:MAG: hypothetical protein FD134_27 [Gallionellaceae bacterium]|nr:MAG: hypothetical protein FD134_27 [Gallionellaceae bacterium]